MKNDDLVKAMDTFGGGLGAHGEVCGAVISGLAAIGLLYGRTQPGAQADMMMWKFCRIFMKRFRADVSDDKILCREMAKTDWMDPNQAKRYRTSDAFAYCRTITGKTAKLLGELLEKAQNEQRDKEGAG